MSTLWHFKIDGMWYKIGIFVYFLRIRLYITETASHLCNIFAHISQNFQWLIMKSFLLSFNIVNRLEFLPSFLPSFLPLSFHSFIPFFWGEDWRIIVTLKMGFHYLHLYCARFWNSVSYQVTFNVALTT